MRASAVIPGLVLAASVLPEAFCAAGRAGATVREAVPAAAVCRADLSGLRVARPDAYASLPAPHGQQGAQTDRTETRALRVWRQLEEARRCGLAGSLMAGAG